MLLRIDRTLTELRLRVYARLVFIVVSQVALASILHVLRLDEEHVLHDAESEEDRHEKLFPEGLVDDIVEDR